MVLIVDTSVLPQSGVSLDQPPQSALAVLAQRAGHEIGLRPAQAVVEPVLGRIATLQGKHVLLRGLNNASSGWNLLATCHNLRKLHGHLTGTGLGSLRTAI